MAIYEHLTEFYGKPVKDYDPTEPLDNAYAYRISEDYNDKQAWLEKFNAFLADPQSSEVNSLLIGTWTQEMWDNNSASVVEALVTAHDRLPNLKALFLGEIVMEESEISWIHQSDVSPMLVAYPELEHFQVRGGNDLSFGTITHANLKTLIVESGGLDGNITRQVVKAHLPALEHLELWFGTEEYGGTTTLEDLQPLLDGENFPFLKYLGLRDSEFADQIAHAIATAPIMERIDVLDLSLGTLGDEGAVALLTSPNINRLKKLDIHYHYCTDGMVERLKQLSLELDASQPQTADVDDGVEDRFVAVSE
jgi:hypothetical protein